jgi:uncharacterized membrane protein
MLVPLPIGLFLFSLAADIIYRAGWGGPIWVDLAFYTMAGGIVGALAAAVPGLVDYLSLRARDTRRVATAHLVLNLALVAVYAVNLWLRTGADATTRLPFLLSILGLVTLAVSGWLGGELVYVHGVGVEPPGARTEPRIETRPGHAADRRAG